MTTVDDVLAATTDGTLTVDAWPDSVIDKVGVPVDHLYVETFWLPQLGPSATWALRRLARIATDTPGQQIPVAQLGQALGIAGHNGRYSPLNRTLARLIDFRQARLCGDVLHVRRRVPPLTRRQVDRLPACLQAIHEWPTAAETAA